MKVLFISNFLESSGWGVAAREYLKALSTTNLDITARPLFLGGSRIEPNEYLRELIEKRHHKYDVVILKTLPSFFEYNKDFGKHIGLIHVESRYWKNEWPRKCNMMDQMIVPSKYSLECLYDTTKIIPKVVNIPVDQDKFTKEYPKLPEDITGGRFNFYFIGEFIERKNLDKLLVAFHSEFKREENVGLIIKTGRAGMNPKTLTEHISKHISELKKNLRLYKKESDYLHEILITDHLSEAEMNGLHQSCDCFVMPSSGESWVLPAADAIGFGNRVIMTETGLYHDLREVIFEDSKTNDNQYQILAARGILDNIYTKDSSGLDLYSSQEIWLHPTISELRRVLRTAFENRILIKKFRPSKIIKSLSYEKIGSQLKEIFCQLV